MESAANCIQESGGFGRVAAVVLAAGGGTRFGGPKQFELLAGVRLVDRAVALARAVAEFVVVALPSGRVWDGGQAAVAVVGGETRNASLANALTIVPPEFETIVVIDSIRPFATAGLLIELLEALAADPDAVGAAPVVTPPDTVKRLRADGALEHVGRNELRVLQTPIVYRASGLRTVMDRLAESGLEETIELERQGRRVIGIPGDPWSHHIVTPADLRRAEAIFDL